MIDAKFLWHIPMPPRESFSGLRPVFVHEQTHEGRDVTSVTSALQQIVDVELVCIVQ